MLDPHQNAPAIASKSFRSRIVWALRRVDFFSIVDPIRGIDEGRIISHRRVRLVAGHPVR